jgi:serine/threonine protein phosphatase 1
VYYEAVKTFDPNTKGKDYVVGDLHGCYTLLMQKLESIGFDKDKDRLFSVGDLIDRGSENEKCLTLLDEPWFNAVRGNHEQLLIDSVIDGDKNQHIINGGVWFYSLQETERSEIADTLDTLPFAIELYTKERKKIVIVHADCGSGDEQSWVFTRKQLSKGCPVTKAQVLWSSSRIKSCMYTPRHPIPIRDIDLAVVGHSVVDSPTMIDNVLYIDTGAVFTGNFTLFDVNEWRTV